MAEIVTEATKAAIGKAIYPMLSPFHDVGTSPLRSVSEVYDEGCLDRLILDFGPTALIIKANEDDDTIYCQTASGTDCEGFRGNDVSESRQWSGMIGHRFGWGWVTVNQQGYCDGMLLSFGGIIPQVLLNVRASSIEVRLIAAT